jgi:hypothetical protein
MTGRRRSPKAGDSPAPGEPPDAEATKGGDEQPPGPGDSGGDYEPPGEERDEAVEAHAEFVERHFGGGVEATPEILDRAMDVWQRLPGAVVRGAAQIRPNRPNRAAAAGDEEGATP